jgi:hypothetical protein
MNDTEISGTVAALLVGVGLFLKHQTPLPNNWIPSVLMVVAVGTVMGLTQGWGDFSVWIRAVMAGFAAVGAHAGGRSTKDAVVDIGSDQPPKE